jgi:predicted nuclease with RNAse H fold
LRYCGITAAHGVLALAMLEEVRTPEPPVRLSAIFYAPGDPAQVAAELRRLGDVVVAVDGPLGPPADGRRERAADSLLRKRGVTPRAATTELNEISALLAGLGRFSPPGGDLEGTVGEGDYADTPVFETNADGVYCAMQGRRLPARRHPLGVRRRIDELEADHVTDEGGDLWHRRIEELDAVAAALCAHRYAVGHASWIGDPDEGVIVLPGASIPEEFSGRGVLPPVERLQLPQAPRG